MVDNAPFPGTKDPLSLHGVIPPTITVFHEDETVNTEATADHARFVVDSGVHGVFPLGTNGEFPLLTAKEREQVIDAVVNEVEGEVPIIAGVGAASTHATIRNAKRAARVGVDGLVVITPYYYPIDQDGLLAHYRQVIDAVDLPVYLYHIPSKTGNEVALETLNILAKDLAGVKDSSKRIPWLGQAIDANPELTFLSGSDSLLFPGLEVGCAGTISAVANVFPGLVVSLYEAYDAGDEDRAQELQSVVYDIRSSLKKGPYMAGVKAALSLRNVPYSPGPLRYPLHGMDEDELRTLERNLERIGAL